MSGLLDMFVRRRRASAATRLGPQSQNGAHRDGASEPNRAQRLDPVVDEPLLAPAPPPPARTPVPRNRSQMRRRARYLRQLRELQLRDIGGFLVECYRFSRARPDLVETKMQDALETDRELRALERALGDEHPRHEVREPGIAGSCPECGSVHGSGDRFCAWCGHRL
jgi:zinc-ribbon domain